MRDYDKRLSFVEHVYHPLVRGFLGWARDQAVECLEGSGREWGGLLGELELLLSGEHPGPDPMEEICPPGIDSLDQVFPLRMIDHAVVGSDFRIGSLLELEGAVGVGDRLVWTVRYLDHVLAIQERILTGARANRLQLPNPDYSIIEKASSGIFSGYLHHSRSAQVPEFDYPMSDFELEMVKEYARVVPPFEDFSDNSACVLGVYRWLLLQAEEAARTEDGCWRGVSRMFDDLECGEYADQSPELIIASDDPAVFDLSQLRYFYLHALKDIDANASLVVDRLGLRGSDVDLLKHFVEVDIDSKPAVAAWYLEADLRYLEALAERAPQLVA